MEFLILVNFLKSHRMLNYVTGALTPISIEVALHGYLFV